ncbi:MAG: hypothetical protein EOP04_08955 [Proteobacteria bacterium]|nr:MAG: hypothetical protein EOP04_08955 [Pseudomonadota bacterium]
MKRMENLGTQTNRYMSINLSDMNYFMYSALNQNVSATLPKMQQMDHLMALPKWTALRLQREIKLRLETLRPKIHVNKLRSS